MLGTLRKDECLERVESNQMIHVIEPTLESETGHCYSFISSLCAAAQGYPLRLWIGKKAHVGFAARSELEEGARAVAASGPDEAGRGPSFGGRGCR